MNFKRTFILIYFILIFTALAFIVLSNYFSLDEPNVLWSIKNGTFWTNYYDRFLSEGRPLFAFLNWFGLKLAGSFESLKYLRLITIIITALFCWQVYRFLIVNGLTQAISFLIAVLIFSLPGFSVFIGWSITFSQHISTLLSFFAGGLTAKVFVKLLNKEELSRTKESAYVFCAICIQILSLFIYQGFSLVFMLPAFILVILNAEVNSKNRIKFYWLVMIIFFIALGIYYQFYKSMLWSNQIEMTTRGKVGVNDYSGKVLWFFGILKEASRLYLLLLKNSFFSNIFSFIIVLLVIRDLIKKRFLDILFLMVTTILFILPHLLVSESWGASRNFVLIEVGFVFYFLIRISEFISFTSLKIAFVISTIFIGIMCMNIYEGWRKPMHEDFVYLKEFVEKLPIIQKDTFYISYSQPPIYFHDKKSYLKLYFDEFNAPIFYRDWPIEPAIKCMYDELHPELGVQKIDKMLKIQKKDTLLTNIDLNIKNKFYVDFNY